MKVFLTILLSVVCLGNVNKVDAVPTSLYDISVNQITGKSQKMAVYQGKVLLIVNTASQCGYTPQYKNLQALYEKYHDKGFEVLAFPCNDFGGQEPDSEKTIVDFVKGYSVTFPMFEKISIKGENIHPLYEFLLSQSLKQGDISVDWNFSKFLVDGQGHVVKHYPSSVDPMDATLLKDIEKTLEQTKK